MPTKERAAEIRKLSDEMAIQKAKTLGMCGWSDCVEHVITQQERDEINTLWLAMDGSSFWMQAMWKWLKVD